MSFSTVILATVVANFATNPDLCADVYLDEVGAPLTDANGQTFARYCGWAGPDAPVLDADICCTIDTDGAHCSLPDAHGRCALGLKMWCERGETLGDAVLCLQPLPSTCEFGICQSDGSELSPSAVEDLLCCEGYVCTEVSTPADLQACIDAGAYISWCEHGALNEDGTVDCFD